MRALAGVAFAALFCGLEFSQTAPAPAFDIADVHASPRHTDANVFMTGGILRNGRYDLRNAAMLDLIRTAWNVDPDTVLGGPTWLELDRFDIVAKAPPNTPPETLRLMLQALLADRFKLVLHKDMKPMPGFVLTVGKGKPKMKEADGSGSTGCQGVPQKAEPGTVPSAMVTCHNMTMEEFAPNLRGMAGAYMTSPVVDSTDLKGAWDFDLKWTPRALLGQAGADAITIFDAVDKQLGLKLEPQKLPQPVLFVDSVNEKPTANSPEVARVLPPPPPAEFEVAVVKLSMPDETPSLRVLPGGQVDIKGVSLQLIIDFAWNLPFNANDMIVGAPKFLDSTHYDILAKANGVGRAQANLPPIDIDDLKLMLRALLADRFKLATHMEDRSVSAYNLVAVKPKMKQADPANRTGCKEGPGADGKDPRNANPTLSRLLTCQNMTMAQFVEQLPRLANGYIHRPVLDTTELDGAYDFTLSFSAAGLLQSGPGRGGAPNQQQAEASDPNGALSLPDAISKHLGLKLEEKKRPVPVLVIDHVEEKPTDN